MQFGCPVIVESAKPARKLPGWPAAAAILGLLTVLDAADVLAASGGIYQRRSPGGALELSNIPAGEGFTLLLAAPAPVSVPVAARPAPPEPVPAAASAEAGAPVAVLDPNQLLEMAPPAAGPAAAPAPAAAAAAPVAAAAAPLAPAAANTPSATAFAARLARYRDFTVSRSTDLASP